MPGLSASPRQDFGKANNTTLKKCDLRATIRHLSMANSVTWPSTPSDTMKSVTLHIGDTLRVHYKLIEKEKIAGKTKREVKEETRERTQVFEGILIAIKAVDQ